MARLNWQKVAVDSKRQAVKEDARNTARYFADNQMLLNKGIWTIGTKHYGKKITNIPTQYLCWFTKAQEEANKIQTLAYHKAAQELRQRYSSHKVSGPDSNTAVEKPVEIQNT
tara:strand:+ start:2766 stop:3104 length:339 start_codon:yes stop_codon:yes gene_type:complete